MAGGGFRAPSDWYDLSEGDESHRCRSAYENESFPVGHHDAPVAMAYASGPAMVTAANPPARRQLHRPSSDTTRPHRVVAVRARVALQQPALIPRRLWSALTARSAVQEAVRSCAVPGLVTVHSALAGAAVLSRMERRAQRAAGQARLRGCQRQLHIPIGLRRSLGFRLQPRWLAEHVRVVVVVAALEGRVGVEAARRRKLEDGWGCTSRSMAAAVVTAS
ncbi:MAG: hypothetical protein JWN04_2841 [Myxococcaceae bacterium]|nr:hypothetical protein [Myxococcaceae bacterium]